MELRPVTYMSSIGAVGAAFNRREHGWSRNDDVADAFYTGADRLAPSWGITKVATGFQCVKPNTRVVESIQAWSEESWKN